MTYEIFQTRREELYSLLDSANHSVSYAAHLMDIDPSDKTISGYESALDYAAKIRQQIGENGDAETAQREKDACIVSKPKTEIFESKNSFDLSFILQRQKEKALTRH